MLPMSEKRLKLDTDSKVPRLNEDVMGIILDFVVEREQNRLVQGTSKLWCNDILINCQFMTIVALKK